MTSATDVYNESWEAEGEAPQRLRFLRALPGGQSATGEETLVAGIVLASLLFLYLARKGFRPVLAR